MATASLANLVYMVGNSLLFLVLTPLTLGVLGPVNYGVWTIMLAVLQIAGLANFGAGDAVVKYVAQFSVSENADDNLSTAVTLGYLLMLVSGVLASLALWGMRYLIARQILAENVTVTMLGDAIGLIALGLLPLFLGQVSKGILLGLVRNELAGGIDFLQNTMLWVGAFFVGLRGSSLLNLGMLSAGTNLFIFVLGTFFALRLTQPLGLHFVLRRSLTREIFRFSSLTWISSLGISLFQSLDRVLVGVIIGPAAAGAYAIASSVALRLTLLAGQFTQVLTPYASSYQAKGRTLEVQSTFRLVSRLISAMLAVVGSLLAIWIPVILSYWISPEFSRSYSPLFRVMIVAYAIFSISRSGHQILSGLGEVGVPAIIILVSGAAMLASVWVLGREFGILGAGAANFVYSLVLVLNVYLAKKLGLRPWRTIIADSGMPLLLILLVSFLPADALSLEVRLVASLLVVVIGAVLVYGSRPQLLWRTVVTRGS